MILQQKMFYGHAEMVVLKILANGPLHPYGIRHEMQERSKGHFCPSLGRLYPLLEAMEKRRWVGSRLVHGRGEQQRKQYTITATGRRELAIRIDEWQAFEEAMNQILTPRG